MAIQPAQSERPFAARLAGRDMAGLLALAVLWRVAFLLLQPRVLDTADAVHYATAARHLASGAWEALNPKIPLLYPALGALLTPVLGAEWGCRVVSLVASAALVVPVFLLALRMHGLPAARTAGVLVALWPWLADYGCRVATESLAVSLWLTGALLLPLALREGGCWRWLAPLPWCALHFTRPEGTVLLVAAPVLAAVLFRPPGNLRMLARCLWPYALLAGVALALSTVLTRALTGETNPNYRVGFIFQEFDLLRFVDTTAHTITDVVPVMLGPVLLGLLGLGLLMPRPRPRDLPLEWFVLLLCLVQWATSLAVLSPAPRYLMAPLVALMLWSAVGMVLAGGRAAAKPGGRWLRWVPLAAALALMLLNAAETLGGEWLGQRPRQPREYQAAGIWLRDNQPPGLIFTRKPQVAFYAEMPSTGPAPGDTLDEALGRARAAGADYLVVDERYTPVDVPGLAPLLDPANAPPALELLHEVDHVPHAHLVVYRIAPEDA